MNIINDRKDEYVSMMEDIVLIDKAFGLTKEASLRKIIEDLDKPWVDEEEKNTLVDIFYMVWDETE